MPSGDLAIIIPARNEADRIGATVMAASTLAGADIVVVVDDGSTDQTAAIAASAGAHVVRHARNRGKAAAIETGAEAVRLIETGAAGPVVTGSGPRHLLFLDADLADSAAAAGPLAAPVRAGTADMTIAVFTTRVRKGGFGIVTTTSGFGIERATGWRPAQPLNGQRCLTRAAFTAALPLAAGLGRRDRHDDRPAAQGHADHRGRSAAVAPGDRERLAGSATPAAPARGRGQGAGST